MRCAWRRRRVVSVLARRRLPPVERIAHDRVLLRPPVDPELVRAPRDGEAADERVPRQALLDRPVGDRGAPALDADRHPRAAGGRASQREVDAAPLAATPRRGPPRGTPCGPRAPRRRGRARGARARSSRRASRRSCPCRGDGRCPDGRRPRGWGGFAGGGRGRSRACRPAGRCPGARSAPRACRARAGPRPRRARRAPSPRGPARSGAGPGRRPGRRSPPDIFVFPGTARPSTVTRPSSIQPETTVRECSGKRSASALSSRRPRASAGRTSSRGPVGDGGGGEAATSGGLHGHRVCVAPGGDRPPGTAFGVFLPELRPRQESRP